MSIFNKSKKNKSNEENPNQNFNPFDNVFLENGIRAESEFYHQPEEYQLRANPENVITLGILLNKTFDVRKEEFSDMYVVSNYHNGIGEIINNEEDIWNYDLCSHLIEQRENEYSWKNGEVILIISYRDINKIKDKDIDHSKFKWNGIITIHLKPQDAGSMNSDEVDSFYICATICMPPIYLEKWIYPVNEQDKLQPKALSVRFAFDTKSSEQKKAEFDLLYEQTVEKVKRDKKWDELTLREQLLLNTERSDIGAAFYWGRKVLEEKRFWDAILYFTKVYDELNKKWLNETITDEEKKIFFESCYQIGFCFVELKLYEKALYYLNIVFVLDNIEYKMEYIICLSIKKDFRAIHVVRNEIERISKIEHPESLDWFGKYYLFLWRRMAFIYIDMGKLNDAEALLKDMLNKAPNNDIILKELAYIQQLRKNKN